MNIFLGFALLNKTEWVHAKTLINQSEKCNYNFKKLNSQGKILRKIFEWKFYSENKQKVVLAIMVN